MLAAQACQTQLACSVSWAAVVSPVEAAVVAAAEVVHQDWTPAGCYVSQTAALVGAPAAVMLALQRAVWPRTPEGPGALPGSCLV